MGKIDTGDRFYTARTKLNRHTQNGEKEESIRKVSEATGVPASSLSMYEGKGRLPETKNAQILADYYGVNVLWLLGKSDSWSLDENSQIVTKMTGLSTLAIDNLHRIKDEDDIKALNHLLESDSIHGIISWLSLAETMIQKTPITKVESWDEKQEIESSWDGNYNVEMKLSPKESARYFLSRAIQLTEDTLSLIVRELWTEKVKQWTNTTIKEMNKNGKRNKKN